MTGGARPAGAPKLLVARVVRLIGDVARAERASYGLIQTFATQVLVLMLNIATGIVTARLLGAAGRGEFTAITIWPQLLATIGAIGLPSALVYFVRRNPATTDQVVGAALQIGLVLLFLIYASGYVLVPLWLGAYDARVRTVAEICILFSANHLFTILFRPVLLADRKWTIYNLTQYGPPLLYLVFLIFLSVTGKVTAINAAFAILFSGCPFFLYMMFIVLVRDRAISLRAGRRFLAPLLSYAGRNSPAELIHAFFGFMDRLVLVGLLSPAELGLYAVAYSFSRVLGMISQSIVAITFPAMSGMENAGVEQLFGYAFRFTLYVSAAAVVALLLVREPLIALAFGKEFIAASHIFAILLIEMMVTGLGQISLQCFLALARPGVVSAAQAISLLVAIALMVVLVPRYGPVAAAASMLAASLVRLLFVLGGLRIVLRFDFPRLLLTRADLAYVLEKFG